MLTCAACAVLLLPVSVTAARPTEGTVLPLSLAAVASPVVFAGLVLCFWFRTRPLRIPHCPLKLRQNLPLRLSSLLGRRQSRASRRTLNKRADVRLRVDHTDVIVSPDVAREVVTPRAGYTECRRFSGADEADSRDWATPGRPCQDVAGTCNQGRVLLVEAYSEVKILPDSCRVAIPGASNYTEPYAGVREALTDERNYTEIPQPTHGGQVAALDGREYTEVDVSPADGRVTLSRGCQSTGVPAFHDDGRIAISEGRGHPEIQMPTTEGRVIVSGEPEYTEVIVSREGPRGVVSDDHGYSEVEVAGGRANLHYAETCVNAWASPAPSHYNHLQQRGPESSLKRSVRAYNHVMITRLAHAQPSDVGFSAVTATASSVNEYDVSSVASEGARVKIIAQHYDTLDKQLRAKPSGT